MKEKFEDLELFFIRIFRRLDDILWALKPKNWKFWIVKPKTLNIQYNDARDLYLHTSMKVLCDFYHNQLEHGNVCWDCKEEYKKVWKEIEEIAYWWENVHPTYDLIWTKPDHIEEPYHWGSYSNKEDYKEYWEWLDGVAEQEVINEEIEQQMVERLSKIYRFLWD